jgi:hypothetical protein
LGRERKLGWRGNKLTLSEAGIFPYFCVAFEDP